MNSILFYCNNAFSFTRKLTDLQDILGYKYPAAQQLFGRMFSKPQMVLQEMTVPAGFSQDEIIQRWVDNLVVTRVIYHADYGGFNVSKKASEWMQKNCNVYLSPIEIETWLGDMPRHHPTLLKCFDVFQDNFGTNIKCAVILGTKYKIQDIDGFEQVRTPYMDKWIDATEPVKPAEAYVTLY